MMDKKLIDYTLMMADSLLVMAQQLCKWNGHGPVLEQDMAMTNIVLDQVGQSRLFYQAAAKMINDDQGFVDATEDTLAYLRNPGEFRNTLLSELPNGDWGQSVMKVFLFAHWQWLVYSQLIYSPIKELAEIAEKALKEVTYHISWSNDWIKRLGDGTEDSHTRMQNALDYLWLYTDDMLIAADYESVAFEQHDNDFLIGLKQNWFENVSAVLNEATLNVPAADTFMHMGGKACLHTEHLSYILGEMQYMQRAYPGQEW